MQNDLFVFAGIGIALVLGTFSALLGPDRLLKLLVANIIFMFGIIVLYASMGFLYNAIEAHQKILPEAQQSKGETMQSFLVNAPKTIGLLGYCFFLYILFTQVKDFFHLPRNGIQYTISHLALIPLSIIGFVLVIQLLLFGTRLFDYQAMLNISQTFSSQGFLTTFLMNTPYILFVHTASVVWLLYTCLQTQPIPLGSFDESDTESDHE